MIIFKDIYYDLINLNFLCLVSFASSDSYNFHFKEQAPEVDSLPVIQLRTFLNEINMCPGKFERKIRPLTETLNSSVDDDDTMRAVVNVIFDEVSFCN